MSPAKIFLTYFQNIILLLTDRHQLDEQQLDKTLAEYGDTVMWKVLENVTVKSLTQAHAVKALIITPDANLDPEMIQRKK